jgi:DNA-binding phage protein
MAGMGQKETKVTDLCSELAITRQTLYRHLAPDGTPAAPKFQKITTVGIN